MALNEALNEEEVIENIATNLERYYEKLLDKINKIKLDQVVTRKNPYLFYAKNTTTASEIIDSVLFATISSSEETMFGQEFFEPLAIFVSGGNKSMAEGADVEVIKGSDLYLIAVKSGTSVFNSDSRKRQEQNFQSAASRARQAHLNYHPIIGYCYGRKSSSKDKFYEEFAGQEFWTFLTGDPLFYKKILRYMGDYPDLYKQRFDEALGKAKNRLVREFVEKYCDSDGSILWDTLLERNSGVSAVIIDEDKEASVQLNTSP